ncbi:uncharacterized protein LOC116294599 [Actinia tenebrosa]|uniref:Uncharacterized protein LOC116294599 n=1 Tax=Actinia tenebrosa TaxID=6105 RepID=A0A6P8HR84_ACTTE|nr:uncharacterized protein LOC116294599 [Actinia tenebrosa]
MSNLLRVGKKVFGFGIIAIILIVTFLFTVLPSRPVSENKKATEKIAQFQEKTELPKIELQQYVHPHNSSIKGIEFNLKKATAKTAQFQEKTELPKIELQQYVHPHNSSVKGIEFNLSLHIYSLAMQLMAQLESGKKVEKLTMDSLIEAMAPVTAISSNHFHELIAHLGDFHRFVPNKKLVVYDLGLTQNEVSSLKGIDYVEYRKLNVSVYPEHVRNLHSYAFKPLVIQQVLAERGGVLWMDSSVKIRMPYTKLLEQMVNSSSGFLYYLHPNRHNILSATQPRMFEYLPMNNLHEMKFNQPQATGFITFNTPEIRKFIFKWAILCSLVQDCIIPKGSTIYCGSKFPEKPASGCHRYDQSMFSILVRNEFGSETKRYIIGEKLDYADVNRMT